MFGMLCMGLSDRWGDALVICELRAYSSLSQSTVTPMISSLLITSTHTIFSLLYSFYSMEYQSRSLPRNLYPYTSMISHILYPYSYYPFVSFSRLPLPSLIPCKLLVSSFTRLPNDASPSRIHVHSPSFHSPHPITSHFPNPLKNPLLKNKRTI